MFKVRKVIIEFFSLYWQKINKLLQRFLTRKAVGFVVGFMIGVVVLLILQEEVSTAIVFIAAAFAGVFAEIFIRFLENAYNLRIQLNPLNQVLGTIATEDAWIYISAWRRNMDDLEHSKLYRNDPERQDQPLIVGSNYVYGKGDATALSYVYKAIEKATGGKTRIFVEDSERTYDEWNRSAICIGAHNSKTREILDKFTNTYFKFEMNYKVIVEVNTKLTENQNGIRFVDCVKQLKAPDSSDIDYAILLKLKDQYHPEKTIIVIAGLGDSGSAGAAYYLLTHADRLPFTEDTFGVLIEIPSGPESAMEKKFRDVARPTVIDGPAVNKLTKGGVK